MSGTVTLLAVTWEPAAALLGNLRTRRVAGRTDLFGNFSPASREPDDTAWLCRQGARGEGELAALPLLLSVLQPQIG